MSAPPRDEIVVDGRFIAIQPEQKRTYEQHKDEWQELADRMVAHGEYLVMPLWWDEAVPILIDSGRAFTMSNVELQLGEVSRCHVNVSRLHLDDPDNILIASGYALGGGGDNKWRQHSWAVTRDESKIIETTSKRDAYFGVVIPERIMTEWAFRQVLG